MQRMVCLLSTLLLGSCATPSIDEMRQKPPTKMYISESSPENFSECVLATFNSDVRGFERIRFDGAKSYRQGDRTTILAETGAPMYILDVTQKGDGKVGSVILERQVLEEWSYSDYLKRFRGLTESCLM